MAGFDPLRSLGQLTPLIVRDRPLITVRCIKVSDISEPSRLQALRALNGEQNPEFRTKLVKLPKGELGLGI